MKNTKTNYVKLPRGGYRLGSGKDNFMNTVLTERPNSNTFDLTHDVKMTGQMGNIYPAMVMDVIPGDRVKLSCDNLVRLGPMLSPVMDRMDVRIEYFMVPNRIIWKEQGANMGFEKFIANEPGVTAPYISYDNAVILDPQQRKFMSYFGVPVMGSTTTPGTQTTQVSALPFAAYQMIYNEWYRPEYLENPVVFGLTDGDNTSNITDLLKLRQRAYDNDYFTAALPFAQKGTAVDVPMGDVLLKPSWDAGGTRHPHFEGTSTTPSGAVSQAAPDIMVGVTSPTAYDPDHTLEAGSTSVNDLRLAEALQRWLEMFARVGSRFKELIKGFFGVEVEDYRLDRPEYIVGSKAPVIISEVLNTTGDPSGLPQGNMAGHGVSVMDGYQDSYHVKEHGYIIGVVSVMPRATYFQGIPRHFLRKSPQDYYWPQFANLGEQSIQQQEIYAYELNPTNAFGYMPRYSEYRTIPNRVCGEFTDTLSFWTLSRIFGTPPSLNDFFLKVDNDDVSRIFADPSDDYLLMHIQHNVIANRPIPVYGTPQLV